MADQNQQQSSAPSGHWHGRWGGAVQAAGVVTVLICSLAVILGPFVITRLARRSRQLLGVVSGDVGSTADSLGRVAAALQEGEQLLETAAESIGGLEETLGEAEPVLSSTADLLSETAPQLIEETQQALSAAEEGAAAVDQVLRTLDVIGFLTGIEYDPEQSLDEGIADAAASLDPLKNSLSGVGTDLEGLEGELPEVQQSLQALSENLNSTSGQLEDQAAALTQLAERLGDFEKHLIRSRAEVWPAAAALIVIWELIWLLLGISQSALIYLGGWMRRRAGSD